MASQPIYSQEYDADAETFTSNFEFDSSGDFLNAQVYSESSHKIGERRRRQFLKEIFGLSPFSSSQQNEGYSQDMSASASVLADASQVSQVQTASSPRSCSYLHVSYEQLTKTPSKTDNDLNEKRE